MSKTPPHDSIEPSDGTGEVAPKAAKPPLQGSIPPSVTPMASPSPSEFTEEDLQTAWENFQRTAWERTWSASQRWFESLTLVQRDRVRIQLLETVGGIQDLPFGHVNTLLVVMGFGAMREGARIAASLLGSAPPTDTPTAISFEELWKITPETMDPTSETHQALCDLLELHPALEPLMRNVARELMERMCTKFPGLTKDREALERITLTGIFHGVQVEYFIPRLLALTPA